MTETSTTNAIKMREWQAPPERGRTADDWPYPDRFVEFLIEGDLAERIQTRFGETAPVYLLERNVSGGYSEYTQENEMHFSISCGERTKNFTDYDLPGMSDYEMTTIGRLALWLKEGSA